MDHTKVGGTEHWRVLTMYTPSSGGVAIAKGDAVKLTSHYTVTNATDAEDAIFGQALGAADENGQAIPVLVSGVARFAFKSSTPVIDGVKGIAAHADNGVVKAPASGNGTGCNLKVLKTLANVSLTSVTAGDAITINGLTFTAHASTTSAADRQFSVSGDNAADAAALASVLNDPAYGVPGTATTVNSNVISVLSDTPDTLEVLVTDEADSFSAAVGGGLVWTLL